MDSYFLQVGLNSLMEAMQIVLLAGALLISYNVSKIVNLGLAAAFTIGAYSVYAGLQTGGALEAFLLFVCSLFIFTALNLFVLNPFIQKHLDLMGLLASVSLWFAVQELHVLTFGAQGRFLLDGVLPTVHFMGLSLPWTGVWTLLLCFILAITAFSVLLYTPLGRSIRALTQHAPATAQLGIREQRIRAGVFFVTTLVAGIIGVFTGLNEAITPMASHNVIIPAFLAFLVGGGKDIRGVFVAALLLVLIPSAVISISFEGASIAETWKPVLVFALALILLLLRPNGLLSIHTRTN